MQIVYNIAIYTLKMLMHIGALFDNKLKLGIVGRRETFKKIQQSIAETDKVFWFHCASLGEYEQGLPVFEHLKNTHPDYKIVLSFFSPSGYEIRKSSQLAHVVVYLPLDTPKNVQTFLKLVHPDFTVFVKYEIWINYLNTLKKQGRRSILISALIRDNQVYFKWYGYAFRNALTAFEQIFVQDVNSQILLQRIGIQQTTIAGDTRFDRVAQNKNNVKAIPYISSFIGDHLCVVIGSSWPEDESLILKYINNTKHQVKFILVPHNIDSSHIHQISAKLNVEFLLYSSLNATRKLNAKVLIINNIGMLSHLYHYAQLAYVGGAVGTSGLHNILEPAVFNIPIVIGNNIEKFPEATAMIKNGGVISIANYKDLELVFNNLISNSDYRLRLGAKNKNFIELNQGAVKQITNFIRI